MGLDYALVHVKYTIPLAFLLTFVYQPLKTRLDSYKIAFLVTIAIVATTPWDSYLIRQRIWGYPANAVLGPTLFSIPLEELFFFFIQTYNTSLFYLIVNKPVLHAAYLREIRSTPNSKAKAKPERTTELGIAGGLFISAAIAYSIKIVGSGSEGTYLGLIVGWAGPFILLLWTLSHPHILSLPRKNVLIPILIPTAYLWFVDTLALRKGTWVINDGTKLGIQLWEGLEIEEATFFLITNVLIVFGLIAFDYALALLDTHPRLFPNVPTIPSPLMLIRVLLTRTFSEDRYSGLPESVDILQRKSRSFYLASGVFEGRLRLDLISLYSFCRAADDLIDEESEVAVAESSLHKLNHFLEMAYGKGTSKAQLSCRKSFQGFVEAQFPSWAHAALFSLPTENLPRGPLDELLEGFRTDLTFTLRNQQSKDMPSRPKEWPIETEDDLYLYSQRVAGTVGELFLYLVFQHSKQSIQVSDQQRLLDAGRRMGVALQYVNIARDIEDDAKEGRLYIPLAWLTEDKLLPEDILHGKKTSRLYQVRLLQKAKDLYAQSRPAIEELPIEARGGARIAVESYMNIGRRLEGGSYQGLRGTQSKWVAEPTKMLAVRVWTAWKVLRG